MPRIVYEAKGQSAHQLERMAEELELSKVKALQLAVSVLSKLSEEIGRGTEIVLRHQDGREVELWLPHLRRAPQAEHLPIADTSSEANGEHHSPPRSRGRAAARAQKR